MNRAWYQVLSLSFGYVSCAIAVVCALMFLFTVLRDVLAGIIVLAVMAVIVYFYLRNPFERKKLDSLIKKIALD